MMCKMCNILFTFFPMQEAEKTNVNIGEHIVSKLIVVPS